MLSLYFCPRGITLSGFHCITVHSLEEWSTETEIWTETETETEIVLIYLLLFSIAFWTKISAETESLN